MKEEEKRTYLEKYNEEKKKGVPFFPDIIFKDSVIVLLVFLVLAGLAYFIGAPLEERANPADTTYTPRPEWYFMFLFQLLKYFPGELEVIGVVVIPTVVIILFFLLPLLDHSARRHFLGRPVVIGFTVFAIIGVLILNVQSYLEAPPPVEAAQGDDTAALYIKNCAKCHGTAIVLTASTNLHAVIAEGSHEGMPAWSGDLTSNEIDALAGFILSPAGSDLYTEYCGECHKLDDLVSGNPLELKRSLAEGLEYPPHVDLGIPDWSETLSSEQETALLNFFVAPDGQRLFATNCAPCHGRSAAFSGDAQELRTIISQGGLHLEMPSWREKLNNSELNTLAEYVVNPSAAPQGAELFQNHCANCHGERIPSAEDVTQASEAIAAGGSHQTMPVWGDILTTEQLDALVNYTLAAASGTPLELGQSLFAQNCTVCHGDLVKEAIIRLIQMILLLLSARLNT